MSDCQVVIHLSTHDEAEQEVDNAEGQSNPQFIFAQSWLHVCHCCHTVLYASKLAHEQNEVTPPPLFGMTLFFFVLMITQFR